MNTIVKTSILEFGNQFGLSRNGETYPTSPLGLHNSPETWFKVFVEKLKLTNRLIFRLLKSVTVLLLIMGGISQAATNEDSETSSLDSEVASLPVASIYSDRAEVFRTTENDNRYRFLLRLDKKEWESTETEPIMDFSRYRLSSTKVRYMVTYTYVNGSKQTYYSFNLERFINPYYELYGIIDSLFGNVIAKQYELLPGEGYTISPSNNSVLITATSSFPEMVSVRAIMGESDINVPNMESVQGNGCFRFSSPNPLTVSVTKETHYGYDHIRNRPYYRSETFDLRLKKGDDTRVCQSLHRIGSSVRFTINPGSGYTLDPNLSTAIVHFNSNEQKFWIEPVEESISAGKNARFFIRKSRLTLKSHEVRYSVTQTGNFLDQRYSGASMKIFNRGNYDNGFTLNIPTVPGETQADDGSITVTLLDGNGYSLSQEPGHSSSATIRIENNSIPAIPLLVIRDIRLHKSESRTVSILSNPRMKEGTSIDFIIGTVDNRPVSSDVTVNFSTSYLWYKSNNTLGVVEIKPEGEMATNLAGDSEVTISEGNSFAKVTATTFDDEIDQGDAEFGLTILPDSNTEATYAVFQNLWAGNTRTGRVYSVTVEDNDSISPTDTEEGNSSIPEISIVAKSETTIEEGEIARFKLNLSEAVSTELKVDVNLSHSGNFFAKSDRIKTVTVSADKLRKIFKEHTIDDSEYEPVGSVTATILEGNGYSVASAPDNSVTIYVADNDYPEISISSSSVTEGNPVIFTISASGVVSSALNVTLSVRRVSNNYDENSETVLTIPADSQSVTHSVDTPNDELFGTVVYVSATLVDGYGYTVNESAGSALVTVDDDESVPVVSIQAITDSVVEGGMLWYLVSADTGSYDQMSVNVSITESTGGFLGTDLPETAEIWTNYRHVYLRVQTVGDEIDETNGSVTVTLESGTGYEVSLTGASSTAEVLDDDEAVPVVSIASTVGTSVAEGEVASFAITTDIPTTENLTVRTLSTQTGDYLAIEALGTHTIVAPGNSFPISYPTADNELDEPDGSITVEILVGNGYAIADSPNNIASIAITDNDLPPEDLTLFIAAVATTVEEGGTAVFGISTEEAVKSELSIGVLIEMNGVSASETLTMDEGEPDVNLPVETMDDELFGDNSEVRVTLLPGEGYQVDSAKKSASVTVLENDSEPEISVEAIAPAVTEGSPVWYLFRSTRASKTSLTVSVSITEAVGSYLLDDAPETIEILAYHRLAIVSLETSDDDLVEGDGSIDVAIRDGEGYGVSSKDGTASVKVLDNDHGATVPTVSAENIVGEMEEGGIAIFRVSASERPLNDITVNLEVTQVGEFISGETVSEVGISKHNTIGLMLVRTVDDDIDEEDGSVTLEILEGTGYEVASGSGARSTVVVSDNDDPDRAPDMTISAISSSVVEGNDAEFLLFSLRTVETDTSVRVNVTTNGNFFGEDTDGIREIVIEEDRDSKRFSIPTVGDDQEEADGFVTIAIEGDDQSPVSYNVYESYSSTTVNVSDDDDLTTVSIASSVTTVEESDTSPAVFTITSTKMLLDDLTINLDVRETGSVIKGAAPETVELKAGQTTVELEIPLSDDDVNEAQSRITATFEPNSDYRIAEAPSHSAHVDVTDNDQFVLRAGMHMDGRRAPWNEYTGALPIEGLPMILYFNTEEPYGTEVNRDITVNFEATDTQGKLISPPTRAVIREGKARSGEILLPTSCNEARETSSTITVRVLPGDGYVSQGDGTFTATLNDIEIGSEGKNTCPGPRVMSISSDRLEITEGGSFTLTITPDGHNDGTYSVFVDIENEVGNFVADTSRREIVFQDGSKQNKHLQITAQENNDPEETGVIKVSIVDTDDSVAGPSGSVRVNVLDNDPDVTENRVVPTATISRVSSEIEEGGTAEFTVRLDSDAKSELEVKVAWTVEGDYLNAGTGTVKVPEDGREGKLSLVTKGDDDIKADGSVTAIIKPGEGYDLDLEDLESITATITILDNDESPSPGRSEALHRSVLPDLLAATNEQTVNAVSSRIDFAFNNAGQGGFEFAGASSIEEMVKHSGQLMNEGDVDLTRVLSGSSFALPMMQDDDAGSVATLWGSGFSRNVSDDRSDSSLAWDGESFSGHLGFDARFGSGLLAGIAASSNDSSVDFRHEDREGLLEGLYRVRMTSLQPYFGWSNDDLSTQLRASAGFGLGEVEIDYDRYDSETTGSRQYSMLLGGTDRLYSSESLFGGSSKLTLNAEAWTARQFVEGNGEAIVGTRVDTRSLRIMADGTLEKQLESGSAFNPSLSFGTRWDGGDDRQGFGIEFSGGAGYESPFGLAISGSGRMLTADGFSKYERGLKGELSYDRGNDGIGVVTSLSPAWGVVDGNGVQQLWNDGVKESDSLGNSDGLRLGTEIGYGIGILDGGMILTPFASTELNEGGRNKYGIGSRLASGSQMSLEMKGIYDSTSTGVADRKVRLEGSLDW